ncbi:Uncharacterised protein [uncultured archaeon]|nr:Uncharacterised protein [uncultured archaeon]
MKNTVGVFLRSRERIKSVKMARNAGLLGIMIIIIIFSPALADHYIMEIGSKSNPNAHLFSYDQKFRETTRLQNYAMNMSASKEFTDATRLSTRMELKALPNLTEMVIDADFIGIGRIGYLILDPDTGEVKKEMSRINHMFVGNFSIEEQIIVAKDHMCECGYLPCV